MFPTPSTSGSYVIFSLESITKYLKTSVKNNTLNVSKNVWTWVPLAPPGGSTKSLFWWFLVSGPKWCPRMFQKEPRGAQSHPKYPLLRFSVDLGWILMWVWVFLGVPGSAQAIKINIISSAACFPAFEECKGTKIWAAFLQCLSHHSDYQNVGSLLLCFWTVTVAP